MMYIISVSGKKDLSSQERPDKSNLKAEFDWQAHNWSSSYVRSERDEWDGKEMLTIDCW